MALTIALPVCSRRRVRSTPLAVAFSATVFLSARAFADGSDAAPPTTEVEELARAVAQSAEALSTHDCVSACNALGSLKRATARLCALDPGPRCTQALSILQDATRRVHDACPQCANAALPTAPTESAPPSPTKAATPLTAEHKGGGCAGCSTGHSHGNLAGALVFALGFILFARRRRTTFAPQPSRKHPHDTPKA